MIDNNTSKTWEKVRHMATYYRKYLYQTVAVLDCEISEIPAPARDPESLARFQSAVPTDGWRPIRAGEQWGENNGYAWFRARYTVPPEQAGKNLAVGSHAGERDGLLFVNGEPFGLFDGYPGEHGANRLHEFQPLTDSAVPGTVYDILLEGNCWHPLWGCMPEDNTYDENAGRRTFTDIRILSIDMAVADFLLCHDLLFQLIDTSRRDGRQFNDAVNAAMEVFRLLPQMPDGDEPPYEAMAEAVRVIRSVTERSTDGCDEYGYAGLIGHSHLDTAWQWPVRETLHKAARTFSNALRLMERYPDYKFVQSSAVYLDWMRVQYPSLFEKIRQRVAEGRWEPIGSAWVECDDNITGGEYMIRQFLRGQRFTEKYMDYESDCFWQPDTFGYSAAMPQILRGCGIRYFLTTKLSWNEANPFPHDSFLWRGIDGSEVLTHFNVIHCHPNARNIRESMKGIKHRDVSDMKLISYGFGDGGGGPSYSMQEEWNRIQKLPEMPRMETTTVTDFMHRMEGTINDPPVFSGELYLELHRGTLTQLHDIKRSNRLLEKSIRNAELLSVMADRRDNGAIAEALDTLLVNQFHDILPGTCIADVNLVAIHQNYTAAQTMTALAADLLADGNGNGISVCNTLPWERRDQITVADTGVTPAGYPVQTYTDLEGEAKLAIGGVTLRPLAAKILPLGAPAAADCPFTVDGEVITTPFATVRLTDGVITSYRTKSGFEVVRPGAAPLNTLYVGEDIPRTWDNWDLDYDQSSKMNAVSGATVCEVVSIGALQLRVRVERPFGKASVLRQDIVFYADTPRIDFETVVDWQEKHTLLKMGFDVDVLCETARHEIQFGNIKRPTHENYGPDKSQFEVCNHKWTDLSDTRFGVAILNDCKYGISVSGSDMRLTLHKGGCRPDPKADAGKHATVYSLLVHECGFGTEAVIRPAYELNYPPVIAGGNTALPADRSLFTVTGDPSVILETVKFAEDDDDIVVRLYEAEGTHATCTLQAGFAVSAAAETDMLERHPSPLTVADNAVTLTMKPFEIKTVKFTR